MLRRLSGDARGGITVLGALSLTALVGFSALAVEFGQGLLRRVDNQRIADLAAYAGALAYNSSGSTTTASSTAGNIAALNGVPSSAAASSVVVSPSGNGNQAVRVTVTTSQPLVLAKLLNSGANLQVGATSYAEIKADAPGCIIALSGSGSGVSLTGGATLAASGCTVASNTTITAHACSNTITTKAVSYNTTVPSLSCALVPPSGTPSVKQTKASTADPLASNSAVTTATGRISSVSAIASPSAPTVIGGAAVSFAWSSVTGLPAGCTLTGGSGNWTATCTGAGPYTFGSIALSGGVTATINTSASTTYNFNGDIGDGSGVSLTFGPGMYKIKGGIIVAGSMPIVFGAGTFNIGTTTNTGKCGNTSGYSICASGSGRITFGGPSSFVLAGGIYANANVPDFPAVNLGYGTSTNSFTIGKSGNGYSLTQTNGVTGFGDATGAGGVFQMAGSVTTTGGTCVAFPAAAQHDINGNISAAGGIYLGSGIYTVNGYVALGNAGGGDVHDCPTDGTTTGLTGLGVTLVVSGVSTVSCNSIASAFCLGAGYSTVNLTAPTSSSTLGSSTAGLAVIGPQSSSNTAAAVFTSGATNTRISGAFYFPKGAINMSGGAALHDTVDANACLMLIGSQVTLANGSAAGSTCTGLGGSSSSTTVALVQ